jgi:diacylglycerol O-acyltransferase / wax synthase
MERLSALDAEFLHLEDGAVHMHIAGACVFKNPPPAPGELEALYASKLHLIPRYRQRVRPVPFELGRPVWADDPHFDLGYHVRHVALPAPGDDAAFCRLMGRITSQPLDRQRPLWETWLVEGLEDGQWALVFKVHHCMVDGIAGVGLLNVFLDVEPHNAIGEAEPWTPRREPATTRKVLDAWGGLVSDIASAGRGVPATVAHPRSAVRSVVWMSEGLVRYVGRLAPTRRLSIEGPIGPHRIWAHSSASLEAVKAIRSEFGGTVNDVVLAAVAGGYRALLIERGDDADHAVVRSLVPVSTRHDDGRGVPDNRVSALLYELPVQLASPIERLEAVRAQMSGLKASHMAEAGELVTSVGDLAPPMIVGTLSRAAIRSMHRFGQQSLNTVTTNVPGPQIPLFCLGREMTEYRPFVPISHGLRVGTAILSYNGRLYFGVTGDYETMPDVAVLADETASGIDELFDLAVGRGEQGRSPGLQRRPAQVRQGGG